MIKIEKETIYSVDEAIRGMRNPMNSWEKSDSNSCIYVYSELGRLWKPAFQSRLFGIGQHWLREIVREDYNCNNVEHVEQI